MLNWIMSIFFTFTPPGAFQQYPDAVTACAANPAAAYSYQYGVDQSSPVVASFRAVQLNCAPSTITVQSYAPAPGAVMPGK